MYFQNSPRPLWLLIKRPLLVQNSSWTNGSMYIEYKHVYIVTEAVVCEKNIEHLYAMYCIEQSNTTSYKPCRNTQCEGFNCMPQDLLRMLAEEQKQNWPMNLPTIAFAYNAMPVSTTGFHSYEIMCDHKALTLYNAGLGLANHNDQYSWSVWVNQWCDLILSVNRLALKSIQKIAKQNAAWGEGKLLSIPKGNLMLILDHPKGHNKI